MNWTTEYPTQPGYYWLRNYVFWRKDFPGPDVVSVELDLNLKVRFIGDEDGYALSKFTTAEWFGPIQPPLELSECLVGGHPPDCRGHIQSPQENCYLDEDEIAVHKNGCIGDKCQLGHIQASIIEL